MTNNNLFFTIIVPVYNSGKYLEDFFLSVKNQKYTDYELIIIDDGSKDNSLFLCRTYEKNNSNVRVYTKDNGGVSSARNLGLEKANGKYIFFLDADDLLEDNALERLHQQLLETQADALFFNYFILKNNMTYEHPLNKIYEKRAEISQIDAINTLFNSRGYQGFIWNKIYKLELIKELKFREDVHYLEDVIFNVESIKKTNRIVFVNEPLIFYRQHEESAVAKFNVKQLTYISALDILESKLPEYYNELQGRKLLSYITFGSKTIFSNHKIYKKLKKNFKSKKNKKFLRNGNYKIAEELLLFIGYVSFDCSIILFMLKDKITKSRIYYTIKKLKEIKMR